MRSYSDARHAPVETALVLQVDVPVQVAFERFQFLQADAIGHARRPLVPRTRW